MRDLMKKKKKIETLIKRTESESLCCYLALKDTKEKKFAFPEAER